MMTILQAAGAAAPQAAGSSWSMWVMMIAIFAIMWFFMIRPQRKQQKELQNFRSSLKKGDKVVTVSGVFGIVAEVREDIVVVEVAKDVKLKMTKDAIARSANPVEPAKEQKKPAKEEKKSAEAEVDTPKEEASKE